MEEDLELDYGADNLEALNQYRDAAEITNQVMAAVVLACKPGVKIVDLCKLGDRLILEETAKKYAKNKNVTKGIGFPTCISPNNMAGHFSPLSNDSTVLKEGDLIKIDLGTHIDGYIVCAAHSTIVTAEEGQAIGGKKADVICAAYFASECALRLFRPGKKNTEITESIQKIAETFKCNVVEGVLSHQINRFVIDGENVVISKESVDHKVEEVTFQTYDVFCFDIIMSTGDGKVKPKDARTTIYKRTPEAQFNLRMPAARQTFGEIKGKFGSMPFSLRNFKDERRAKLGITECIKHDLVDPYPVLYEKPGEYVAQFKFTVVLTAKETLKLTQHPLPFVQSEYSITDPAISQIMSMGLKRGRKKKKRRKKKKGNAAQPMDTAS